MYKTSLPPLIATFFGTNLPAMLLASQMKALLKQYSQLTLHHEKVLNRTNSADLDRLIIRSLVYVSVMQSEIDYLANIVPHRFSWLFTSIPPTNDGRSFSHVA